MIPVKLGPTSPAQDWVHDLGRCLRTGHMIQANARTPNAQLWRDPVLLGLLRDAHLIDFCHLLDKNHVAEIRATPLYKAVIAEYHLMLGRRNTIAAALPWPTVATLARQSDGGVPGGVLLLAQAGPPGLLVSPLPELKVWAFVRYCAPHPLANAGWFFAGRYRLGADGQLDMRSNFDCLQTEDRKPEPRSLFDLLCEELALLNCQMVQIDAGPPAPATDPHGRPWRDYARPAPSVSVIRLGQPRRTGEAASQTDGVPLYHVAPHDRRAHLRRLKDGRVILVRAAKVNGGHGPSRPHVVRIAGQGNGSAVANAMQDHSARETDFSLSI